MGLYIGNQKFSPIIRKSGGTYFGCSGETFLGEIDANGELHNATESIDNVNVIFTNVKSIGAYVLARKFDSTAESQYTSCRKISGISFPDLTTINGIRALYYLCSYQSALANVSFPELATITGEDALRMAFSFCTNLTTVSFPKLTSINGAAIMRSCFQYCTSLTDIYFNSLTQIIGTNATSAMLTGVTGCKVHLPTGYSGTPNMGGTNTVYVKDL